jgi:hypothetical protein
MIPRIRIACVHATTLAIGPVAEAFKRWAPGWECNNVVEERLVALQGEGDAALALFLDVLRRAEAGAPAVILTTCSMYTRRLPEVRPLIGKSVVGIDEPMIEKAAEAGGPIALVGSIEEAVNGTARLIRERAKARGRSVDLSRRLLVDPKICTQPAGVRELEEKIRPLIQVCHAVVVVQASLSVVEDFFTGAEKEKILTSPRLAVARLKEILEGYPS